MMSCPDCERTYSSSGSLHKHRKTHHGYVPAFKLEELCPHCNQKYQRLAAHISQAHRSEPETDSAPTATGPSWRIDLACPCPHWVCWENGQLIAQPKGFLRLLRQLLGREIYWSLMRDSKRARTVIEAVLMWKGLVAA